MAKYTAQVVWTRQEDELFTDNRYSRGHYWLFDGGVKLPASSSSHIVPRYSVDENVDPEEAFVASLSSCHMLFFLSIAAQKGFIIDEYRDDAVGVMAKNDAGKMAMTEVILRPRVTFSGDLHADFAMLEHLHHLSHEECFIANSVHTKVMTEIQMS
ncbi:OsmC family protein [Marinomonas posidonica]|uniref:OsmC family protein n=1 Tax=Marinomonas posidonica (strain CECT 7376 / NCIMB 14433 / IVIA-Po-181) TaxID=491952 RepID=F6CXH7_MARPP|nr:OsmC family protein [Marinomonas posidonica]AEF55593.1 OsmC family protein [Marinomonas posidonica IVIA-Po-181]